MVRIHNVKTGKKYVAHSLADCRDATDASMFRTCIKLESTITMGGMVAEYLGGNHA